MVQDFGENRKAAYCSEIKSAHFGKSQITVHPMVCFYRLGQDVVRESHVFHSNDIQHDHNAVREFTLHSLDLLMKTIKVTKVTMWSDGVASQYKGRGTFYDLSVMSEYEVQKCYFGSEHCFMNIRPDVGDYLKLKCFVNKRVERSFYAVVFEVLDRDFSSVYGSSYVFSKVEGAGLIAPGPPDYYTWVVLTLDQVKIDK